MADFFRRRRGEIKSMIQFDYSDERRLELAKKAACEEALETGLQKEHLEEHESNAINLFKNGASFELVRNSIPSIKESRLKELQLQAGVSK